MKRTGFSNLLPSYFHKLQSALEGKSLVSQGNRENVSDKKACIRLNLP